MANKWVLSAVFYLVVIGGVYEVIIHPNLFVWAIGGCWLLGIIAEIYGKGDRERARRKAHTFDPPNVHGNAGNASRKDAKRQGWV